MGAATTNRRELSQGSLLYTYALMGATLTLLMGRVNALPSIVLPTTHPNIRVAVLKVRAVVLVLVRQDVLCHVLTHVWRISCWTEKFPSRATLHLSPFVVFDIAFRFSTENGLRWHSV